MNLRVLVAVVIVAIAGLGLFAWQRTSQKATPAGTAAEPPAEMPTMEPTGQVAVQWTAPDRWEAEPSSGVRIATYKVPAKGAGDAAQCVVYFFGPGQGGGVDANIARWVGEFTNPGPADQKTFDVNGISVHRVKVSGTYVAHGMMSDQPAEAEKNTTLLGAIAEGPNGSLFFKFTGPEKTVNAAESEFDAMLKTLRPRPA